MISDEARAYFTAPPQLDGAVAAVSEAMARLRLVIEHRGGTMLPLAAITPIAVCDGFNVFIDKTEALRVFTRRSSENHHDRLIALLKEHPSDEDVMNSLSASVARYDLVSRLNKLSDETIDLFVRDLEDRERASGVVKGSDQADLEPPVSVLIFDGEAAVGVSPLVSAHSDSPVITPDATA